MSSISFSTAAVIPASTRPSTRLRLTTRGRAVLLAFASVPLAVGIAFAALSGGSAIASGADTAAVSVETVTVMPGDTLWSIATGVAFGFIAYAALKLLTGRARQVSLVAWILAAVFLFKFVESGGAH